MKPIQFVSAQDAWPTTMPAPKFREERVATPEHADGACTHPRYWLLAPLALLVPPIGLVAGIAYLRKAATQDRELGLTLLLRALTLPLITITIIATVIYTVNHYPQIFRYF